MLYYKEIHVARLYKNTSSKYNFKKGMRIAITELQSVTSLSQYYSGVRFKNIHYLAIWVYVYINIIV